jgi:hypothetical protein
MRVGLALCWYLRYWKTHRRAALRAALEPSDESGRLGLS